MLRKNNLTSRENKDIHLTIKALDERLFITDNNVRPSTVMRLKRGLRFRTRRLLGPDKRKEPTMNKQSLACLCCLTTYLLTPAISHAAPADEEKKVFAELAALIPKDHVVTVDDLYKKWQKVQEKRVTL
jgi:hypothetical protein